MDELASLAVSETKKAGAFTLPGIGKLVLFRLIGLSPGANRLSVSKVALFFPVFPPGPGIEWRESH